MIKSLRKGMIFTNSILLIIITVVSAYLSKQLFLAIFSELISRLLDFKNFLLQ